MNDPLNDPRFPNRPSHPDFWKLCEIVLKYDGRLEEATDQSRKEAFESSVREIVDLDSLSYLALQRALRASSDMTIVATLAAAYLEGFVIGVNYERDRAR